MKEFSIDLVNSEKGERKKAVKYLREQGYSVQRRRDKRGFGIEYLSNNGVSGFNFQYFSITGSKEKLLSLPHDWDKLVEYTQKKPLEIKTTTASGFDDCMTLDSLHNHFAMKIYLNLKPI